MGSRVATKKVLGTPDHSNSISMPTSTNQNSSRTKSSSPSPSKAKLCHSHAPTVWRRHVVLGSVALLAVATFIKLSAILNPISGLLVGSKDSAPISGGLVKESSSKNAPTTSPINANTPAPTPTLFQKKKAPRRAPPLNPIVSQELTEHLGNVPTGWGNETLPEWIQVLCPSVVQHFAQFPSFSKITNFATDDADEEAPQPIPYQTTVYAAKTVCTFSIAEHLAASVNAKLFLHAGSHLGALLHGQPIPWDDDADAFMDYHKKEAFSKVCSSGLEIYPKVTVLCHSLESNVIKLWIHQEGEAKLTNPSRKHNSPYLDLFFYQQDENTIWEVPTKGEKRISQRYAVQDYFPVVVSSSSILCF